MQSVDNPKKLFRKIDVTGLENDESYSFKVAEDDMEKDVGLGDTLSKDKLSVSKRTVEFEDLSDPADDFHASLEAIEQAATEVDDVDDVPEGVDTNFHTQEDGRTITYMANTDRMGYEVIKQESGRRLAGYVVIFPDEIVKVKT